MGEKNITSTTVSFVQLFLVIWNWKKYCNNKEMCACWTKLSKITPLALACLYSLQSIQLKKNFCLRDKQCDYTCPQIVLFLKDFWSLWYRQWSGLKNFFYNMRFQFQRNSSNVFTEMSLYTHLNFLPVALYTSYYMVQKIT